MNNNNNDNNNGVWASALNLKMNMDEGSDEENVSRKIAASSINTSSLLIATTPIKPGLSVPSSSDNRNNNSRMMMDTTAAKKTTMTMINPSSTKKKVTTTTTTRLASSLDGSADNSPFWNPAPLSIKTVPKHNHTLEKTSVFVANATPLEISQRICGVLRDRSIGVLGSGVDDAAIQNSNALDCVTPDGIVEFRIALYKDNGGIIVEIQRRFGASFPFVDDARAILDAAKGKTAKSLAASSSSSCGGFPPDTPPDEDDNEEAEERADDSTTTTERYDPVDSSLRMVEKMLNHRSYESRYLGMQILVALTDSKKVTSSPKIAREISDRLFDEDHHHHSGYYHSIGKTVLNCALFDDRRDEKGSAKEALQPRPGDLLFDDDNENEEIESNQSLLLLRNLGLVVLANAATARGEGKPLPKSVRTPLVPVLIGFLQKSKTNPNNAQRSAEILRCCFCNNNNNEEEQLQLRTAFEIAIRVGKERHSNLYTEATKSRASVLLCTQ